MRAWGDANASYSGADPAGRDRALALADEALRIDPGASWPGSSAPRALDARVLPYRPPAGGITAQVSRPYVRRSRSIGWSIAVIGSGG